MFKRPFTITIGKPTRAQVLWAIVTILAGVMLLLAGFAPTDLATWLAKAAGVSVSDMYLILKGMTYASILWIAWFAFGSNQVTVPLATVEHHRYTAFVLAGMIVLLGLVLNWPAVVAFLEKFDLLWALLAIVGIVLAWLAWKRWPRLA